MFALLLTLLILDALVLSVVVLLQAGQGGGLASLGGAGGTDTVLGGRQAVTILTKASWWCGGIFLVLSLILQFVPRGGGGASDLQEQLRAASPAVPSPNATLPLGGSDSTAAPAPAAKAPADTKAAQSKSAAPPTPTSGAPAPEKKKP